MKGKCNGAADGLFRLPLEIEKYENHNDFGYIDFVYLHFGLPNTIISDNGRRFRSNEFIEFYKQYEIAFYTSLPFYPAVTYGAAVKADKYFIKWGV